MTLNRLWKQIFRDTVKQSPWALCGFLVQWWTCELWRHRAESQESMVGKQTFLWRDVEEEETEGEGGGLSVSGPNVTRIHQWQMYNYHVLKVCTHMTLIHGTEVCDTWQKQVWTRSEITSKMVTSVLWRPTSGFNQYFQHFLFSTTHYFLILGSAKRTWYKVINNHHHFFTCFWLICVLK